MPWPNDWDRGGVLGAIEEASGETLHHDDSLPDTLIAKAQELNMKPYELQLWIYDRRDDQLNGLDGWTPAALTDWARLWCAGTCEGSCDD